MGCGDCHSPHDWTQRELSVPEGRAYAGEVMPVAGLPGRVVAPNLTPDPETGLGNWTDDEIARAIREGIGRDGQALFPMMPYSHFRNMPDEDLASIIVFLRLLPPVRNPLPKTEIVFPVRYLIRSAPEPLSGPVGPPDLSTPEKRGAHLVDLATCGNCHTPVDKNAAPIPGMDFAGGVVLEGPWGKVASSNITPDPRGISYYDAQLFTEALRTGVVRARPLNQIMPWPSFRHLTDQDISDIFAYLRTLKPVHHRVDNTETPTLCRLCGAMHGLGDKN